MKKIAANNNYRILKQSHSRNLWEGRRRDQWYEDDRGGMDEGYNYRLCPSCGCKTEHESTPTGNVCISCDDKARARLTKKMKND